MAVENLPPAEHYELVYYGYQVEGRGLMSADQLRPRLESMASSYDQLLGRLMPSDKSQRCVDLACGFGNWLYFLSKKGYANAHGVDLDHRQVELARSVGLRAEVGDAREALAGLKGLGIVSAFDLIEHLDKNDAVRLLEAIYDSLAEGGMAVLRCPCADGLTGAHDWCNDLTHRWAASSGMLAQLLNAIGFSRVKVLDPAMPMSPAGPRGKARVLVRRLMRGTIARGMTLAGLLPPVIWSNSMVAVAWKH